MIILLIFFYLSDLVCADVITLRKDKNVTCVLTGDSFSALYLVPNTTTKLYLRNLSNISWDYDGWMLDHSKNHYFAPITDLRWNELPYFNHKRYHEPNRPISLTLSVCSSVTNISFDYKLKSHGIAIWDHSSFLVPVTRKTSERCTWAHFTMWNKNGMLALTHSRNDTTVFLNMPAKKSWLRFTSFPPYLSKSHSYTFYWSNISTGSKASGFLVQASKSKSICLNLFVSIDKGCKLDIELVTDVDGDYNTETKTINGFNNPGDLKIWQYHRISFNSSGSGIIHLYRRKIEDESAGFWAIDRIQYCHKTAVFTTTLESNNETAVCQTMEKHEGTSKWLINGNEAGSLGGNEMHKLSCGEVLGKHCILCEGHKICWNNQSFCFCAWGYEGDSCKKPCSTDRWGLDCSEKCQRNCNRCNRYNGTCEDPTTLKISTSTRSTSTKYTIFSPMANSLTTKHSRLSNYGVTATVAKKSSYRLTKIYILILFIAAIAIGGSVLYFMYKNKSQGYSPVRNIGQSKVSVIDFPQYLKNYLVENILNNQFDFLANDPTKECNAASSLENRRGNYDNINIPYDESRVLLNPMGNVGTSDYINASYIDGWGRARAYIATQGPKASTMANFWRMIWQHEVKIVVMTTQFRENMERKCFGYFPTYVGAILPAEDFGIKLVIEESTEFYQKRTLEIYYQSYHKRVTHYQLKWSPECGKPLYPNDLVPLVKIMNENYTKADWSPIVVHCHLGVERSAILILSDMAVEMAKKEGYVDVYFLAKMLREQRPNMITSAEDYILAHLVISECLMSGDDCCDLRNYLDALTIQGHLECLNTCTWHDKIVHSAPFSAVNSYENKMSYISMKQPQADNIETFWLMVLQQKIKIIIIMNECNVKLWPLIIQMPQRNICMINSSSQTDSDDVGSYYVKHQLLIRKQDNRATILYEEEIQFYQFLNWDFYNSTESSITTFIQFVEVCRNICPIPDTGLICCSDGITGGLFIATSYIIEKYIKEIEYDISNAVRNIRRTMPSFIRKPEDLYFLYKLISLYSQKFDPYKHIEDDD